MYTYIYIERERDIYKKESHDHLLREGGAGGPAARPRRQGSAGGDAIHRGVFCLTQTNTYVYIHIYIYIYTYST